MSRSYKHSTLSKQQNTKGMKRHANHKVRRHAMELPSKGSTYKKLFPSYDICDWKWWWSKKEAINCWKNAQNHGYGFYRTITLEECVADWKCSMRK